MASAWVLRSCMQTSWSLLVRPVPSTAGRWANAGQTLTHGAYMHTMWLQEVLPAWHDLPSWLTSDLCAVGCQVQYEPPYLWGLGLGAPKQPVVHVQTFACISSHTLRRAQGTRTCTATPSWAAAPESPPPATGCGSTCHTAPRSRWTASFAPSSATGLERKRCALKHAERKVTAQSLVPDEHGCCRRSERPLCTRRSRGARARAWTHAPSQA